MRFHSMRMMQHSYQFEEDEMVKVAGQLIYDSNLERDQVIDRFSELYGEENLYIVEQILDEENS